MPLPPPRAPSVTPIGAVAWGSYAPGGTGGAAGTAGGNGGQGQDALGNFSTWGPGGGGGGGGGSAVLTSANTVVSANITGGNGGRGGNSTNGGGGGGGAGGFGIFATGTPTITVNSGITVQGGNGGAGGSTQAYSQGGSGGGGGNGFYGSGALINGGIISSGVGGNGGTGPTAGGGNSLSVAGVVGTNLAVTNGGAIVGRTGSNGQADAITFLGGTNSLTLTSGGVQGTLDGGIGIAGTTSFSAGAAPSVTLANFIHGTGNFVKTGSDDLTLTGANNWTGTTTVSSGTLTFGSNGIYAANGVVVNNTGKIYGIPLGSTATYRSDGVLTFGDSVVNNTAAIYAAGTTYVNGTLTGTTAGGGVITGGWVGAYLTGNGAVYNSGTIAGNTYQGVDVQGNGSITNYAGGRIVGVGSGADIGGTGPITNDGQIIAGQYDSSSGAVTVGMSGKGIQIGSGTVTNNAGGRIVGGTSNNGGDNYGILSLGALTLTNDAGTATLAAGRIVGGYTGVETRGPAVITNNGLIGAGTLDLTDAGTSVTAGYTAGGQDGIRLLGGGTVTNNANALIQSVGGSGVYVEAASGTVINSGTIQSANGVFTFGGGGQDLAVTNNAGGLIYATGGTGVYQGGPGALTVTNAAGGTILANGGDALHDDGFGLTTVINDGTIAGNFSGLSVNGAIDITNTGLIGAGTLANGTSGAFTADGLYVGIGTNTGGIVRNNGGTIQGGGAAGISSNGALTVTNSGTITTAGTGSVDGITILNAATVTNSGTISAATASGIAFTGVGSSVINTGTITGGSDATYGYGVQVAGGGGTIANLAGGTISGGTGSILVASDNDVTLDLQYQSTTTGQILTSGAGGRTVLIGGALAGDYNGGAGTGVVNWTLGALGSIQAATFGNADDSFLFNGGAIGGAVDAGGGTDAFTSDLGTSNSATLNLDNIVNFESFTQASGNLTVTGTGGNAVQLAGGTFTVDGTLNAPIYATSGTEIGVTANGSIATTGAAAIYTPGGGTLSIVNAGTINSTGSDAFVGGGAITLLNTGTISTDLFQAASGGANSAYTNGYTGHLLGGTDATYGIGANVGDNGTLANYGEIGGGATLANGYASLSGGVNAQVDLFAGSTTGTVLLSGGSTLSIYNGTGTSFAGVNVGGVQLQQAGTNAAAQVGAISLGTNSTLQLRGTGDDTIANGVAGSFDITSLANVATLTKLDTGTWTLTGATAPSLTQINAGTGGTPGSGGLLVFDGTTGLTAAIAVNGGTIRAATAGAFGTGTITTIDPTIQYGATGTYANNIVLNSGDTAGDTAAVSVASGATFDLAGRVETVATLTGAGTTALGAGRLVIGGGNADFAYQGAITGTGDVDKVGTGTLTLAGGYATTGRFNLIGGTTLFSGATAGSVRIQGGTLTGAPTIAGNLLLASGTLSPGTAALPIGTVAAGSLTVTGGTYAVGFGGAASGFGADLLRIGGAATLTGGTVTTTAIDPAASYRMAQTYTILQAGSLTGTFANGSGFAQVNANSADLFWRLRYDLVPNSVLLEVRKVLDYAAGLGSNATPNQRTVGASLNGGTLLASDNWASILDNIAGQSPDQRRATYDSIGGEAISDVTTSVAAVADHFTEMLRQRLAVGGAEDGDASLVAGLLDKRGALEGIRAAAPVDSASASSLAGSGGAKRGGAWIQAVASNGRLEGKFGQATLNDFYSGVTAGVDARIGAVTIGGAIATTHIESHVYARASKNEGTIHQGGGYIAYDDGGTYANAIGSYFQGDIDTQRSVYLGGNFAGRAAGTADTSGYAVGGSLGHRFAIDSATRFALQASGGATEVTRKAYTETGAGGLSLATGRERRNLYNAAVEGRLSNMVRAGGGTIEPYVGGGVRFNFGDLDTLSTNRLTGAPIGTGSFVIQGAELSKTTGLLNGGVQIRPSNDVTFGIGVESTFAKREREGRISASMRIRF